MEPFKGREIIHSPFAPPHHALQTRHKVYFFLSKEVSYDSLRKSRAFQPAGLPHTNTPRLPLSYTIVPINEWNSFTSAATSAGSFVRIRDTGLYRNAFGYVIGASRNQTNECAFVAVLPKVKYPTIPTFAGTERDTNPPPKKKARSSLHPSTLSSLIQLAYAFASHDRQFGLGPEIFTQQYTMTAFSAFSRTNFRT